MAQTNPNADYNELFDSAKQIFPDIYEQAMDSLAKEFYLPTGLAEKLKKKRAFGLEKYGERAFQSTFENAMSSPVAAHLGDEIVDAYNYALHGYYVAKIRLHEEEATHYSLIIESLNDVVEKIDSLRNELSNVAEKNALDWTIDV